MSPESCHAWRVFPGRKVWREDIASHHPRQNLNLQPFIVFGTGQCDDEGICCIHCFSRCYTLRCGAVSLCLRKRPTLNPNPGMAQPARLAVEATYSTDR